MSQENGYTSLETIEKKFTKIRYKDIEISGEKFKLRSWTAREAQEYLALVEKHPKTENQQIIIRVVEEPKFTREDIKRLVDIDSAFIAALAKECMAHVGIDGLDSVEEVEKN